VLIVHVNPLATTVPFADRATICVFITINIELTGKARAAKSAGLLLVWSN